MKLKLLSVCILSALAVACSGGGGSGNSTPNPLPKNDNNVQTTPPQKQNNDGKKDNTPKNNEQTNPQSNTEKSKGNEQPKVNEQPKANDQSKENELPKEHNQNKENESPKVNEQTKEKESPKVNEQTKEKESPKINEQTKEEEQPKENNQPPEQEVPKVDEQPKEKEPPVIDDKPKEDKPEVRTYIGKFADQNNSPVTWTYGPEIPLQKKVKQDDTAWGESFKAVDDKVLDLSTEPAQNSGKDYFLVVKDGDLASYELMLLDEGAEHGYFGMIRQPTFDDKNAYYNQYIYSINQKYESTDIPKDLTATYSKNEGFLFGAIKNNNVYNKANVHIEFKNGEIDPAVSQIYLDANNPLFKIEGGDVSNIIFAPTDSAAEYQIQKDKASMDLKFVDSVQGANDQKYVVGAAKTDSWVGVLGAEKK